MRVEIPVFDELKGALDLTINSGAYELVSVREEDGVFTIESRRFGHGVGMSQRGAQRMAGQEGFFWTEILNFYYPGMALERVQWQTPELETVELPALPTPSPTPAPTPTPAPLPELLPGEYYAVVTLNDDGPLLNIRQGPGTDTAILDRFEEGRRVIVTSEPDMNGWVSIRTAELEGFAKLMYLKAEQ